MDGLLHKHVGYDNVGYDDKPAVYYPKTEPTKEPLYRDKYLEKTTYRSKIKYNDDAKEVHNKSFRSKKDLKLQVPPVTLSLK